MWILLHFVSPRAGELDGSQIGNLMEHCDTTAPEFFCELDVGALGLSHTRSSVAFSMNSRRADKAPNNPPELKRTQNHEQTVVRQGFATQRP